MAACGASYGPSNITASIPSPHASVSINGNEVIQPKQGPLKVPSADSKVQLSLDPSILFPEIPGARIQHRLREVDPSWQAKQGWMAIGVRFQDNNRDLIQQVAVQAVGKSAGWVGSPETSTFTPNARRIAIPQGAAFVSVFIISSGPPASVGTFLVKGLRLTTTEPSQIQTLIQEPESEPMSGAVGATLSEWHRSGSHSSMASRLNLPWLSPPASVFQIKDESSKAHCEWISARANIGALSPGTELFLVWEEIHDVGLSEPLNLTYTDLPAGLYHLDLRVTNAFGSEVSPVETVEFLIPPPFWSRLWFWAFMASTLIALLVGLRHRYISNRFRKELAASNEARLIEAERMRIARDIHDDLGARLTQLLLLSACAQDNAPAPAKDTLQQISGITRELVEALHDTLWTVNPENDHLNAVSDFICLFTQTLCESVNIRYRVQAETMPANRSITSSLRHHIILAVKEAVNNAIKHAKSTQLTLKIGLVENTLNISVSDNGSGFDPTRVKHGHGMDNMAHRMRAVGGVCQITPIKTGGTQICFSVPLPS